MRKPFTQKGWRNLKIVTGAIDAIQIIIDLTGVGEIVNEILDIIIGIALGFIYWWKKVITLSAFIALIISFFGEEMTAAGAPLWIVDVWYTQRSAPPPEEEQGTAIAGTYVAQNNIDNGPVNQGGVRIPDRARQRPLNIRENGISVRPPSA